MGTIRKYTNPTLIERVKFTNPVGRKPGVMTELEGELTRMADSGEPQVVETFTKLTRHYEAPFNYPNILVELGRTEPYTGAEFNPDGVELDFPPLGAITIVEKEPIIGVTVIGSACIPPGYVLLQAEPLEWKYPRTGIKMRIDNLWGQHIRIQPWKLGVDEGWRDAGLSCADFHLPESRKVTLMAGSRVDVDLENVERMSCDAHYCIRLVRVTVKQPA